MSGTQSSYVARAIDVTFTKGKTASGAQATFSASGTNTLTVSGLRVSLHVEKIGSLVGANTAAAKIYGLPQSVLNDLSTLGMIIPLEQRNTVQFFAGNIGTQLSSVFIGTILNAYVNYEDMPIVALELSAQTGALQALTPASPLSFPGSFDVAKALSDLAAQMNLSFENDHVTGVVLPVSYYPGTLLQQAQSIANHAGINLFIDDALMAIWPQGGARVGTTEAVGPDTGMIGYPTFTVYGLDLRTIYNPAITFGKQIAVTSSIPAANGTFTVGGVTHTLEAQVPGGLWESTVKVIVPGYPGLIT